MGRNIALDTDAVGLDIVVPGAGKKSLWRRIFDTLIESRQRTAEREIARYIEAHGGHLTDEVERNISRKFGSVVGA